MYVHSAYRVCFNYRKDVFGEYNYANLYDRIVKLHVISLALALPHIYGPIYIIKIKSKYASYCRGQLRIYPELALQQ